MSEFICFSGKIGSGKSTLSKDVSCALGIPWVSFGDYVRRVASTRGQDDQNRSNLQVIGEELISQGIYQFCDAVLNSTGCSFGDGRVIDGIRHVATLNSIREIISPNKLYHFHISVNENTLDRRLVKRNLSAELITKYNEHSTEYDVVNLLASEATAILDGNKPTDILCAEVTDLVR